MAEYDPTTENDTNLDWLLEHYDDDDDGNDDNTTQPFTPGAASTPYQPQGPYHDGEATEMSNFNPDDIPPVEVDYIDKEKGLLKINLETLTLEN